MRCQANLAGIEVGDGYPVRIVGAINVSPESFYGGSVATDRRRLQQLARRMAAEGADVLDVGAMSTAPYRQGWIPEAEELRRVTAAVRALVGTADIPISVDTQRATVAGAAFEAGARILNDISGLGADPAMASVARGADGVILMAREVGASTGVPILEVRALLRAALRRARSAGVPPARIVLDPGIGFFRRGAAPWVAFDCAVLRDLARLRSLGRPLLVGASRKSFIGKLTGQERPDRRLAGSLAAAVAAVLEGAALIRTHDVAPTLDAVRVAQAVRGVLAPQARSGLR
jgi:dihydropteroate synthase